MARGADEAAWNRTRALAEIIHRQWNETPLPDWYCQPYLGRSKTLTPEQSAENMEGLMAGLGRIFGGG